MVRIGIVFLISLLFISCSKISQNDIIAVRSALKDGKDFDLEKEKPLTPSDYNYLLFLENMGLYNLLKSNIDISSDYFSKASAIYNSKNTVYFRTTGRRQFYDGSWVEASFVHYYQSMNYLLKGEINKSMVEIRAAFNMQEKSKILHDSIIEEKEKKVALSSYKENKDYKSLRSENEKVLALVKSKYLNPNIYYFSGNIREITGERNLALVDYKNALTIMPDNKYFAQDAYRLALKLGDTSFARRLEKVYNLVPNDVKNYDKEKTVYIIFEDGIMPERETIKINFCVEFCSYFVSVALPKYKKTNIEINNFDVSLHNKKEELVAKETTKLSANVFALAAAELQDKIDRLILEELVEEAAKVALHNMAGRKKNSIVDNLYAALVIADIVETADTRFWSLLPAYSSVIKINTEKDFNLIKFKKGRFSLDFKTIKVENGQIVIYYVYKTGRNLYVQKLYQSRKK